MGWNVAFLGYITCRIKTTTYPHSNSQWKYSNTVEPLYNEVLGTMKITLLYQVSRYVRVKERNIKSWEQQNYLVIRGFCYIRPLYNAVPLYMYINVSSLTHTALQLYRYSKIQTCFFISFLLFFKKFTNILLNSKL